MTPCRATGLTRKVGLWKKGARGLAGGEADPIWFGEGGGAREARGSARQMWQREPDVAAGARCGSGSFWKGAHGRQWRFSNPLLTLASRINFLY